MAYFRVLTPGEGGVILAVGLETETNIQSHGLGSPNVNFNQECVITATNRRKYILHFLGHLSQRNWESAQVPFVENIRKKNFFFLNPVCPTVDKCQK